MADQSPAIRGELYPEIEPFDSGTIEVDGVRLDAGAAPSRATIAALRRSVGMVVHHQQLKGNAGLIAGQMPG